MANYKETDVVGKSWIRSHHVVIENPLNPEPSKLTFARQEALQLGDRVLFEYKGELPAIVFDPDNPKHLAIYTLLNELFIEQCEAIDAAAALTMGDAGTL